MMGFLLPLASCPVLSDFRPRGLHFREEIYLNICLRYLSLLKVRCIPVGDPLARVTSENTYRYGDQKSDGDAHGIDSDST